MAEVGIEKIEGRAENPRLNVVFVHGLGGDARKTWLYEQRRAESRFRLKLFRGAVKQEIETKSCFWPEWLAEDMSGLAVYSLDYPADRMGWNAGWPIEAAAVAVLDRLMKNPNLRKSDAPIV